MSDAAPASAVRDNNAGPTKETLERVLKFLNVIVAMFLGATGVLAFILLGSPLTISQVLSASYVIVFSMLLLCFECHLGFMDEIIYRNFGFMFNWGGRLVFLFLNGVLAFALGPMGIAAGCFTGAVIVANMFILCRYRDFAEAYESDFKAMRRDVAARQVKSDTRPMTSVGVQNPGSLNGGGGGAANDFGASRSGGAYSGNGLGGALVDAAVRNPDAALAVGGAAVSAASNPAVQSAAASAAGSRNPFLDVAPAAASGGGSGSRRGEMTEANGWKKYLDDRSGKYYYYHEQTKETRWDTEDL